MRMFGKKSRRYLFANPNNSTLVKSPQMEGTYALWVLRLHWPTNYHGNMQSVFCRVGLRFSELFDAIYNIQQNSLLAPERELHGERSSNIHPREQVWRFIYGIFLAGNCPVFLLLPHCYSNMVSKSPSTVPDTG